VKELSQNCRFKQVRGSLDRSRCPWVAISDDTSIRVIELNGWQPYKRYQALFSSGGRAAGLGPPGGCLL
jgi:hypothetical protein